VTELKWRVSKNVSTLPSVVCEKILFVREGEQTKTVLFFIQRFFMSGNFQYLFIYNYRLMIFVRPSMGVFLTPVFMPYRAAVSTEYL
jgi:hypothetical protein